jgi:NAD+ synthase (glutamine-hydrolysing)
MRGCAVLFGAPYRDARDKRLLNAALLAVDGRVAFYQAKTLLPNYDVFDEKRHFDPSSGVATVHHRGEALGITVCEDAWAGFLDAQRGSGCSVDPIQELAQQGSTLFINISASPFSIGKEETRYELFREHAAGHRMPFIYVNQVGGNDELLFDGRSMAFSRDGALIALGPAFREWTAVVDTSADSECIDYRPQDRAESVYDALVMGIRDYARKCGFKKAVLGLSGGIDSALACCLAAEALGPGNVLGITMPSPFSSRGSVDDSRDLASRLGIEFRVVPISDIYDVYLGSMSDHFAGLEEDITEENIQARIRGNILMAFSNKFGYLTLAAGNKSELAVGYCTLYGDMCGGLAVLADVPKTLVYELARYVNRASEVIPQVIIDKAPSAELRPGQFDQDTLPPYPVLDEILRYYVEDGLSPGEIVGRGFDVEVVRWVTRRVDANEHKRRQAAPGLRVTAKAFGVGRRMPIAASYSPV